MTSCTALRRQSVSRSGRSGAVEAVTLDEHETVSELARFAASDEAHEFLDTAEEDLQELTKSGFEERYLSRS
jgi:hypothetical protein